ncbi:zinc ribbon domain-containing protein [Streptomyces sp. ISL-1]|nr:zinc ribbon domain-containing protein [Streptomyces sp. ISL-1]
MASYCPHCGNPSPDEARFCMKCGRERLPEASAPPPMPPPAMSLPAPPPPAFAAGQPGGPSPVGAFFGRVFRGDWPAAARAAAWPAVLLPALAVVLAIPSYGQDDEVVVGWSDRLRIALAMLLQGFGGGFEVKAAGGSSPFGSDSGFDSGSDSGSGSGSGSSGGIFGDGGGFPDTSGGGSSGYGDSGIDVMGAASLSLVPLTVTLLWIGALYLGARTLRTRGAGLEAAVRLSLLVTGVVLVLGLFAQPEIAGVAVSSSPLLAALGALAISLVVTCGVLQRDDLAAWLAERPAARAAVRALGTAVRALGAVLALCSLVGFVAYANADDVDGTALLVALPILPNIGFAVLGLSWGVPVEYDVQGQFSMVGSSTEHGSFGLPEINDVWGGGAVAGALGLGVVCALMLGVWAARRSADRREQLLAGGFSLGLVMLLLGVSGVSAEVAGGLANWGGQGTFEFAPSVPDALLFGLLWVGAATFLGPYVLRMAGQQAAVPPVPPVVPLPVYGPVAGPMTSAPAAPVPATPPAAAPHPADPNTVHLSAAPGPPAHEPTVMASMAPAPVAPAPVAAVALAPMAAAAERKRKVLVWTATLTAAFVIGGGATAGALLLKKKNDNAAESDRAQNKPPAASQSPTAKQDPLVSASPSASPSASASVSPSETASTGPSKAPSPGGAALPAGFVLKQDPAGFTVGVMDGWKRRQAGSQVFYEGPTGGSYIQIGIVKNTPVSSYENFLGLEKKHLETPENDYRRSRLSQNTYQGRPGALWEFTHIPEPDEGGLRRHVIDQAFVAADGTEYAILAAGRADLWDANRDVVFSTAINTFKAN